MMYIYFGSDFKGDVPGSVEFVKRGRHRAQSAAAGLDCAVQDVDLGERRRGAVPLGVALPCGISTRAYPGQRGALHKFNRTGDIALEIQTKIDVHHNTKLRLYVNCRGCATSCAYYLSGAAEIAVL